MDSKSCFFLLLIAVVLNGQGTTPGLESIIKGRCYQYKEISSLNRVKAFSLKPNVDCNLVWDKFRSAFAYRKLSTINETAYDDLFSYIGNTQKSERILFWTGTRGFVHDFSKVNGDFVVLEDTFPGYLANNLQWCGCTSCPKGVSPHNTSCGGFNKAYWVKASKQLANKAANITHVIVNGTVREYAAYWRKSVFGKDELPRIGALKQIKELVILVAHDLDYPSKEQCGTGTIKMLEEDAIKYGIPKVTCHDNPVVVLGIMCTKYPHAQVCKRMIEKNNWKTIGIAFIVIGSVFMIFTAILLYAVIHRRISGKPAERMSLSGSGSILENRQKPAVPENTIDL